MWTTSDAPTGTGPSSNREQTHDVLSELLGYSEQKIKTLQNAGVVDGPDWSWETCEQRARVSISFWTPLWNESPEAYILPTVR